MAAPVTMITLALLWLAMLLAGGPDSSPDTAILNALYAADYPGMAVAARWLTELGGWRGLIAAATIAAAVLILQRRFKAATLFICIVAVGRLAVDLQKLAIARLRPDLHDPLVQTFSSSFPSAHSANSAITYLAVAWLIGQRPLWVGLAAVLVVSIGISRIMLGVHWPSDVIGGWSFGLLWLIAAHQLFEPPDRTRD